MHACMPVCVFLCIYVDAYIQYIRNYVHILISANVCVMTGLGCSFLTENCTNSSVYPYLCDVNTNPIMCTPDHLSKVRTYVRLYAYKNICN